MNNIQEKLQKLFAMAENNSNVNEVAIALEKAAKLMQEYNLSKDGITKESDEYITGSTPLGKVNREKWKDYFANLLAEVNFCKCFHYHNRYIYFFGKRKNVDLVIFQLNNIIGQLERICDEKFQIYKMSGGKSHGKVWKNNFFFGCFAEISEKLHASMKYQEEFILQFPENTGKELMLLKNELEVKFKDKFGKMGKGQKSNHRFNSDGYVAGLETGKEFQFNNQLK